MLVIDLARHDPWTGDSADNPSASFDAAGMAGIIKIIYKQDQELGFSGDLGVSVGIGQFTKQRQDLPTELGSFSNNDKVIPQPESELQHGDAAQLRSRRVLGPGRSAQQRV